MTICRRPTVIAIALLVWTSPLLAQPTMSVEIGWGNNYRLGTWNPIFLTVSNSTNRQVLMEMTVPVSGADSMDIRQSFAIGPTPTTYALYCPLPQSYQLAESTITLRDAITRKRLEDAMPLADPYGQYSAAGPTITPNQIWGGQTFIGHSGRSATREGFSQQFTHQQMTVGHLPVIRLPEVAIGYQCLDALVLDAPNFTRMTVEQQRAIADWVRAGGTVIMWASEEPMPDSGPLIDLLPVRIGQNRTIELSPGQIKSLQLQPRSGKLRARALAPASDAQPVKFFDDPAATGYRRTAGLGTILVLPFEAGSLQFINDPAKLKFWRPALKDVLELPPEDEANNNNNNNYNAYGRTSQDDHRRQQAITKTMDWLGDIPGAGAFGFGYVAFMLIGMMIIVGPVDWFVLKWLGRQPWTWVTTSGWIALVTLGAVFVGNLFKSGDLHYRTVRLIDQVEGLTAADLTVAGLYSPSTTTYDLTCDPESWWQPATETMYYGRQGRAVELPSHQDYRGTRPVNLPVNIWNLRFIEGQKTVAAAPMIAADLSLKDDRLTGTIRNLGETALVDVQFRTGDSTANHEGPPIAPGQTVQIDLPLVRRGDSFDAFTPFERAAVPQDTNWTNQTTTVDQVEPTPWSLAGLAPQRSKKIDKLLRRGGRVCITAALTPATPAVKLHAEGILHKHAAFVRAVFPLK
jgi:hypothetical protein